MKLSKNQKILLKCIITQGEQDSFNTHDLDQPQNKTLWNVIYNLKNAGYLKRLGTKCEYTCTDQAMGWLDDLYLFVSEATASAGLSK